jgi:hypothetical protein
MMKGGRMMMKGGRMMMKGGRIMITVSCKYYADVKLRFFIHGAAYSRSPGRVSLLGLCRWLAFR